MSTIYLVEMTGVLASGHVETFRYSTGAGYVTKPADTPANTHYAGRLLQPCLFEKSCHGGARTIGLAPIGSGTVELENSDGALDGLVEYAFDGQTLLVKRGDEDAALSTFTTIFQGTMDQPEGSSVLIVRARDALQNLDVSLQSTKFLGTNSLPNGLEGTASDLGGKPKPICFGTNYNISPPCVNTSRRIYQIHYKGMFNYVAATYSAKNWALSVYDKRSAITRGAEKTLAQFGAGATALAFTADPATDVCSTGATLHTFTTGDGVSVLADSGGTLPAGLADNVTYYVSVVSTSTFKLHPTKALALIGSSQINITDAGAGTFTVSNNRTALGNYDYCNDATGGFYIRLGSEPQGQLTCDVVNGSDTSGGTQRHLGTPAGLFAALIAVAKPSLTVNTETATYFRTPSSVVKSLGIYIDSETTVLKAVGQVLDSMRYFVDGGSSGPDIGSITIGQLGYEGSTSLTLTEGDVIDLERVGSQDKDRGIPSWRFNLRYKKNYTVMTRDQLVGSATEDVIAAIAQEWLTQYKKTNSVLTQYPNSPEITQTSLHNDLAEAIDETDDRHAFYDGRHDIFRVVVAASKVQSNRLGQRVSLTHSRFSLSGFGSVLWIMSIRVDLKTERAELLLLR